VIKPNLLKKSGLLEKHKYTVLLSYTRKKYSGVC